MDSSRLMVLVIPDTSWVPLERSSREIPEAKGSLAKTPKVTFPSASVLLAVSAVIMD